MRPNLLIPEKNGAKRPGFSAHGYKDFSQSQNLLELFHKAQKCRNVKYQYPPTLTPLKKYLPSPNFDVPAVIALIITGNGFLDGSVGKESTCNERDRGDSGSIPESGRSLGGGSGNPLQYSCLGNSMDRGA